VEPAKGWLYRINPFEVQNAKHFVTCRKEGILNSILQKAYKGSIKPESIKREKTKKTIRKSKNKTTRLIRKGN
jgi:hypothetical protein